LAKLESAPAAIGQIFRHVAGTISDCRDLRLNPLPIKLLFRRASQSLLDRIPNARLVPILIIDAA
jgi:hypothetical protein